MIQIIDENFNLHVSMIPGETEGMNVFRSGNITYIDSGLTCDTFNIIHITDGTRVLTDEVSAAIRYYADRKLAFCVWINDLNLTSNVKSIFTKLSLKEQNREPGMILKLENYQISDNPLHSNIVIADTVEHLEHFARVIADNWSPSDKNVISYYRKTSRYYLTHLPDIHLAIYYEGDKAVSVIEMFDSGNGNIGLYALATLKDYRGKGIGSALMTFALNKAKLLGHKNVILQASEDGIGIYHKLGFEVMTMYYEYA